MKKSLKAISFFTLVCFVPTQVFSPAQGWSAAPASQPEVQVFLPDTFQIPEDLGRIENAASNSGPALIHIQTAHGNYEAQQKIRALLHYLKTTYGIKTLFIEGSVSKLEPERLRFFPEDMPLTMKIADDLTKKAYVKGPELFLLEEKNADAYGIENAKIYNDGGKAFLEVLTQQKKTGDFVRTVDTQIDRLEGILLNKDLRAFLKRLEDYESDRLPVMDWLSWLKTEAVKRLEMNLEDPAWQIDWPMLVRLFKLQEIEKKMDLLGYQKERENFIKAIDRIILALLPQIKSMLSPSFSHQSLPYPQTEILFEKMVSALPSNFNYEPYPNVKLFIGHLILQSEIKADLLMKETGSLADKISEKLAAAPNEKKILSLLKNYRLLQKLFRLELTPGEYETIRNAIKPSLVINQFLSLNSAKRVRDLRFEHLEEIDSLFDKALGYYHFVKERDHGMMENIEKCMKEKGIEKAVVITGGFHAQPFTDYFTEKGYRYALVSPKITATDGREAYVDSALKIGFDLESSTTETMSLMDPSARVSETAKQDILQIITRDLPAGRHFDPSFPLFQTRSEARTEEGTEFQDRLWNLIERSQTLSGPQLLAEAQWLFSQALPENKAKLRDSERQALELADLGRERRQREKADLFAQIKKVTSVHAENIAVLHKAISQPSLKGLNPEMQIVFLFFAGMAARILSLPFGYDRLKTPPEVEISPDLELDEIQKRLRSRTLADEKLEEFYYFPLLLLGDEKFLFVNPFLAVRGAGLQPERELGRFVSFLMNRENPVVKIEVIKPPAEGEFPFLKLSLKNSPVSGENNYFRFFLLKERLPDFPEVMVENRQQFLDRYFVKDARELERFALAAEEGPRKKLEKVAALLREYMAPEKILVQDVYSLFSEEGVSRFARFIEANEREGKAIEFLYRQRIAIQDRDIRETADPRGTIQKPLTGEELGLRERKIMESIQKWENQEKLFLQKEEEKRKLDEETEANRTVLERLGISAEKADEGDRSIALKLRKERELLPWMENLKVDEKNFFEPWFHILFQRKKDGSRLIPEDPAGNLISHFDRLRRELGKLSFDKNFTAIREKIASAERPIFNFEVLRALLAAMDSKAHKKDPGREALSKALLPAAEAVWKTPLHLAPASRFYRATEVLSLEAEIKQTEEEFRRNLTRPTPEDSVPELEATLQKIQTLNERQAQGVSPLASSERMAALDLKNQAVFEKSLEDLRTWVEKLAVALSLKTPLRPEPPFDPDFIELRRLFQQEDFERFFPLAKELLAKKGGKEESLSKLISQMSGNYSAWVLLQTEELENASKFEEALDLIKKALTETGVKELLPKKTALEERLSIQKTGFPAEIVDEARRLWKTKGDALKKDNKRRIEREFLEAFQGANFNSGTIRNRAEKIIARWKSHANPSASPDYDRAIHSLAGRVDAYFKEEDLRRSEMRTELTPWPEQVKEIEIRMITKALQMSKTHQGAAELLGINKNTLALKIGKYPEIDTKKIEIEKIKTSLAQGRGNINAAAGLLEINPVTLRNRIKEYELQEYAAQARKLSKPGSVAAEISPQGEQGSENLNLKEALASAEKEAIFEAMKQSGNVVYEAAKKLGINRMTLSKKIEEMGGVPSADSSAPESSSAVPRLRTWEEREREYKKEEKAYFLAVYEASGRNKVKTGAQLGLNRNTVTKKVQEYGADDTPVPEGPVKLNEIHPPSSLERLQRDFFIAALIFYGGSVAKVSEMLGPSRETLRTVWKEKLKLNFDSFRDDPPAGLVLKYADEIRRGLNEDEKKAFVEKLSADFPGELEKIERLEEILGVRAVSPLYLKKFRPIVKSVDQRQEKMRSLSDAELSEKATALKDRIQKRMESLSSALPEALALFKEASRRETGMLPSREQVLAALSLHHGHAVEMEPGEGKTLSIALAAYVNALTGKGVHIHTFNDYLAKRDAEDMGRIFSFLGLSIGVLADSGNTYLYDGKSHFLKKLQEYEPGDRTPKRNAYQSDITYGSKEQFVYDFLYDQMTYDKKDTVQRTEAPALLVVDEGDSILLDEAANPLVIGQESVNLSKQPSQETYMAVYEFSSKRLQKEDFVLDSLNEDVQLNPSALEKASQDERLIKIDLKPDALENLIHQALIVRYFHHKNSEYVIKGGKVVLVDEFTGRLKETHVLGNHQHQLIAAKERRTTEEPVQIQLPIVPKSLITYQMYYRMMKERSTFSMITGTMGNEAPEIKKVYGLDFVSIPLQFKSRMTAHDPVIVETKEEKDNLILETIKKIHEKGNPILIFVRRISDVINLERLIRESGAIESESIAVIHGQNLDEEASIISNAGKKGRVTIASIVAGRGTNIGLLPEVEEMGGLHVIETKIHKAKRINDQQRLRAARRGQRGESHMLLSYEDEAFRRFGKMNAPKTEEQTDLQEQINESQAKSEAYLRNLRERALAFDEALDPYRKEFYQKRNRILDLMEERAELHAQKSIVTLLKSADAAWQYYLEKLESHKFRSDPELYRQEAEQSFSRVGDVLNSALRSEVREKLVIKFEKMQELISKGWIDRSILEFFNTAESIQTEQGPLALELLGGAARKLALQVILSPILNHGNEKDREVLAQINAMPISHINGRLLLNGRSEENIENRFRYLFEEKAKKDYHPIPEIVHRRLLVEHPEFSLNHLRILKTKEGYEISGPKNWLKDIRERRFRIIVGNRFKQQRLTAIEIERSLGRVLGFLFLFNRMDFNLIPASKKFINQLFKKWEKLPEHEKSRTAKYILKEIQKRVPDLPEAEIRQYLNQYFKEFPPPEVQEKNLEEVIQTLWDERMQQKGVFLYDLSQLREKQIGKYIIQRNPGRYAREMGINRPDFDPNPVEMPFGTTQNFNEIYQKFPGQKLFEKMIEGKKVTFGINYAPLTPYHFLAIPYPEENKPQVLTEDALRIALSTLEMSRSGKMLLGFNSLGMWASVNHLHFQGIFESADLPIEQASQKEIKVLPSGVRIFELSGYPLRGLIFKYEKSRTSLAAETYPFVKLLQEKNIPHILIARQGQMMVLPRRRSSRYPFAGGFGFMESAGRFYVTEDQFKNITEAAIEGVLQQSSLEEKDFKQLVGDYLQARSEVRSRKRMSDVPDPFPAVYVLNKPLKHVSALQRDRHSPDTPSAVELLPPEILQKKGHIMGRLDKNTEGLLLYGGDSKLMGYLLDRLSYPENSVNKVYTAVVEGDVTEENLKSLREGVTIRIATRKGYADHFAKAVEAAVLDRFSEKGKAFTRVSLVLNEGKQYQVRKMLAKVGHPVLQLMRVAVGEIKLGDLESGKWREATPEEYAWLKEIYQAGIAADQKTRAVRKQAGEKPSSRSEVRAVEGGEALRKINAWSAEEFFDQMRAGYESGTLKWTSKYEDWAALKTKQEKTQGAGVLVFRKIQGQWKILLGRQTSGDSKGFYGVPSGAMNKKSNAHYEKAANIAELIRLKIADKNDRKVAEQESVPAGALRELFEEVGIRGRIAGRFNDSLIADKALRMSYFIHIDGSGSETVAKGNGELEDLRWVPLWVILQSGEGKAGEAVEAYLKGGRLLEGAKRRGFNEVKKVLIDLAGPQEKAEEIEMEGRTKITHENIREFLRPGGYIRHSQEGVGRIVWVKGNKEGDPRAFNVQVVYLNEKGLPESREYREESAFWGPRAAVFTATGPEKEAFDETRRESSQAKEEKRDTRAQENIQELESVRWTPYGAPYIRGINPVGTNFSKEAANLKDRKNQIFHFGNASEVERKILAELLGADLIRKINISEGDIRSKMNSRKKLFLEKLNAALGKNGRLSKEAMAKAEENIFKSELFQKWLGSFDPATQKAATKEDIQGWIRNGFIYVEWILKYEIEKNPKSGNKISMNPRPLPVRSEARSFETPVNLEAARTLAKFTLGIFLLRAAEQWQRSELRSAIETMVGHSIAYAMLETAAADLLAQLGPGPFQLTQKFLSAIQQGAGYQIVEYPFLKLLMKSPVDLRRQLEVYEKIQGGSAEPIAVTFLPGGVTQEAFMKDILKALGQKSAGVADGPRKRELAERIAVKIPAQGQSAELAMAGYAREKQGKVAVIGLGAKAVPGLLKFAVLQEDMERASNLPVVSYYMVKILQIAHEIDTKLQADTIKELTAKYLQGIDQAGGNVFILSKITELAVRALAKHAFESAA